MGAGSYVRYGSHSSYVSTAHVTATFTYLRVVVRTVGNAGNRRTLGLGSKYMADIIEWYASYCIEEVQPKIPPHVFSKLNSIQTTSNSTLQLAIKIQSHWTYSTTRTYLKSNIDDLFKIGWLGEYGGTDDLFGMRSLVDCTFGLKLNG
ncbi:uncharacterized protein BDR25DRAFT_363168 [Lindgomyces ingoldianus]|uniref:Uncharacterized protein n=1 Tax=Lindgomyces ingoldianus TaxID=673940 RepID=A0ACB6Q894_9PLEO|nr:uncharacterized protein BDR25DRAFT_363168 [Lindgomyces ingoldianus]KAF2463080.1 hypothetical protein BDR25DRAFT_363168 [Lindgomyces ingoldianus]